MLTFKFSFLPKGLFGFTKAPKNCHSSFTSALSQHISTSDIFRYVTNEVTDEERKFISKALQEDTSLFEIMEYFEELYTEYGEEAHMYFEKISTTKPIEELSDSFTDALLKKELESLYIPELTLDETFIPNSNVPSTSEHFFLDQKNEKNYDNLYMKLCQTYYDVKVSKNQILESLESLEESLRNKDQEYDDLISIYSSFLGDIQFIHNQFGQVLSNVEAIPISSEQIDASSISLNQSGFPEKTLIPISFTSINHDKIFTNFSAKLRQVKNLFVL